MLNKLSKAMAAMPNPVKDTKAYNYKYETLDQVIGIVRPALNANGLDFYQHITTSGTSANLCLELFTTDGTETMTMDSRPVSFCDDPQKNGSAETYARRYQLKTVFGLCGEDDDGQAASKSYQAKAGTTSTSSKTPPETDPQALETAKQRLAQAIKAYCEANGEDVKRMNQSVTARQDYQANKTNAEWFDAVAFEFEQGC